MKDGARMPGADAVRTTRAANGNDRFTPPQPGPNIPVRFGCGALVSTPTGVLGRMESEPWRAPMSTAYPPGSDPLPPPTPREQFYLSVEKSQEFQELRGRYRRWVLPVTAASLLWYFAYVLLAAYAPGFMGQPLLGNLNVGLIMGLLQFVTTFGVTALYVRFADRVLDPASERIRQHMESGGLR